MAMDFNCYHVLHDGEGPLGNHHMITAHDMDTAAERMASKLWDDEEESRNYDDPEDGDYQWVAVQCKDDGREFRVYQVFNRVKRELVTFPMAQGRRFTREQIAAGDVQRP